MTYREYQKLASRTYVDLGEKLNLLHMVVGVVSEYNEYKDSLRNHLGKKQDFVNTGEELADMLWYIANYCTIRDIDFTELFTEKVFLSKADPDVMYWVSSWSDLIKANVFYNKEINRNSEELLIHTIVSWICERFEEYPEELDVKESLEKNIEKLKQRFPDKFSEEKALNRDLKKERAILEA